MRHAIGACSPAGSRLRELRPAAEAPPAAGKRNNIHSIYRMNDNRITWLCAVALGGALAWAEAAPAAETPTNRPAARPPLNVSTNRPAARDRMAVMTQRLKLSEQQATQLKPIMDGEMEQLRNFAQTSKNLAPEERRAQYSKIRDATNEKAKPILKPEQWEQWQQMRGMKFGATRAQPQPAPKQQPAAK
jgi:hypothetical protein